MAVIYTFNVQYYNASGSLYGTYQIKFYDTNYGTEETPEYYSNSPGLSGYTNAWVEDADGEALGMEVLSDGSFMTNSENWMFVFSSATGPLKVYSNDFKGGTGGGDNTPSTGVLQGETYVILQDENENTIWEESVKIYTGGSEDTPCLEGSLTIPNNLLEQYGNWEQISGCYYDYFDGRNFIFYAPDDILFTENIVIRGYSNGGGSDLPSEPILVTITYIDETGTYPTETDSVFWYPDNGYGEFTAADWSERLNSNGESFSFWKDEDDNYYDPGSLYRIGHENITLYARWNTYEYWNVYLELYDLDGSFLTSYHYTISNETPVVEAPSYSDGAREVKYWSGDNGPYYPGDSIGFGYDEQTITLVVGEWNENSSFKTYIKINGTWKTGSIFLKQGTWKSGEMLMKQGNWK